MKSLVIVDPLKSTPIFEEFQELGMSELEGIPIKLGLLDAPEPDFDPTQEALANQVLIEKDAFSCNYRDKPILIKLSTKLAQSGQVGSENFNFSFFGSEFVGRVLAKGKNVHGFEIGDRVIPDGTYQNVLSKDVPLGIPSNVCSKRLEVLDARKVAKVPDKFSNEVASSFTIGGQTAQALVRRTKVKAGDDVLLTSPSSNTSLFAIALLRKLGANIYVLGSQKEYMSKFRALGVKEVFLIDRTNPQILSHQIQELSRHIQFDVVIDPFADTWLFLMSYLMKKEAIYSTCGYYNQFADPTNGGQKINPRLVQDFYQNMIVKNQVFLGNCLGSKEDLVSAFDLLSENDIQIDQVFSPEFGVNFLERTYNSKERFGKVVLAY